ncbi:MAG: hypothetical protein AAGB01_11525 [Cyanobacteria bacterium P01_F01_bin.42]
MYTIEVMMKGSSMALAVQKKEEQEANSLFRQLTDAQNTGNPTVLEMACDKDEGKKVSVRTQEVVAVQISEKSSGTGPSGAAGFFGLNTSSENE